MKNKVVFLVGPTAAGKSATAIFLAQKIGGEIISCDSMQVYRRMNIVTSKPSDALREKVPHHLIGVVSPQQEYNVSQYRRQALAKMKAIIRRGRIPIFAGGTGLYMSILVDGIFEEKSQDPRIRQRLYRQAQQRGGSYLYKQLRRIDPEAAVKIHPHDTRRIVRALEVFKTTGRPISQLQKERNGIGATHDVKIFCLNLKRTAINRRIDARVDSMFAQGLVGEVQKLFKQKLSKTASYAIGLKELRDYFAGNCSLNEAKALMKHATRQYARRQLTWFRKDRRIQWITVKGNEKSREVAAKIWKRLF